MHEKVYVRAPACLQLPPGTLLRLKRSLYGCRQSGRNFSLEFGNHLLSYGFKQCKSDSCVYVYERDDDYAIIGVHVDDGLLCCSSERLETSIVAHLRSRYDLGCLRDLEQFLGLAIDNTEGGIQVHAEKYINECAHRFGVADANPVHTPSIVGQQLRPGEILDNKVPYSELVGSLIYLSTACRPDIAAATNSVARFMSCPTLECWQAAKRILVYLKTFPRLGLRFTHSSPQRCDLHVYSDSDWGGSYDSKDRRRSMTGYLLYHNDNLISWKARSQRTPALSVCEAELMAAVEGAKEAMFLRNVVEELGLKVTNLHISTDSDGAYKICSKPSYRGRVRHMELRWCYLRELIEDGVISMSHLPGKDNPADALTKALARERLQLLVGKFMHTCARTV